MAEGYERAKEAGLIEAGVPAELGGGGADVRTLCDVLRRLAHGCSSTALALSMHMHQVAFPAWRWRHQQATRNKTEPLLKRIASERLILLSSGGGDWIGGSGTFMPRPSIVSRSSRQHSSKLAPVSTMQSARVSSCRT